MRTRLIAAGVAVAVVGAGLLLALFYLPPVPTDTRTHDLAVSSLGPNATQAWTVSNFAATTGSMTLSWSSLGRVAVSLWKTTTCPVGTGVCPQGPAIVSWSANLSGHWSYSGSVPGQYLLTVTNVGSSALSFVATLTETYQVPTPSQVVPAWALIAIGGLVLLGIGGVAVFLGLFLPGDVYRPPRYGAGEPDPDRAEGWGDGRSDPSEPRGF